MENQNVYLKPVTLKNILKFAVPTIAMTVFMSFYTMVDGLFVSNLIGTGALSAINLTAPLIQLVTAISTMLATGGSAVIMKKMGEQKTEEAKEDFTFLILVNVLVGFIMCGLGYLLMNRIFAGINKNEDNTGQKKDSDKKELKEYLGHTPFEVLGGALLGILIAMLTPTSI